ncbi:hypothetical protein [Streptomyces sp. NPDC048191]|uniref:hypothetical protein n=1 Tax=Streptomyces sp. NPDC048191 TaxID=3155484 RepID=UPI0033C30823
MGNGQHVSSEAAGSRPQSVPCGRPASRRHIIALPAWYHLTLDRPDGGSVEVTGVPAQHGPGGSAARHDRRNPSVPPPGDPTGPRRSD